MKRFRVSKTSIGCGASVAALLTILQATGLLPPEFQEPEVVAAITGLLTTLGAAFQVCHVTKHPPGNGDESKGELQ
jgi:hypothetical protein